MPRRSPQIISFLRTASSRPTFPSWHAMADKSRQIIVVINYPKAYIVFYRDKNQEGNGYEELDKETDADPIRPDLAEVIERHSFGLDEHRPEAVARRHQKNQRTTRENVEDLFDPGSFIEYGALAIAAQRGRRSEDELIRKTPADGLIAGIGSVNGSLFGDDQARCMVLAYDYTVLAGTQGHFSHKKKDRMLKLAHEHRLPLVLFAEGGGGRPGDTDAGGMVVAGLDLSTFGLFAGLSGKVPLVGIVSGYCFAGNASLLGCCDVIIATRNSNIGMGGPVMVEGGGLGTFLPEEIGPIDVQTTQWCGRHCRSR